MTRNPLALAIVISAISLAASSQVTATEEVEAYFARIDRLIDKVDSQSESQAQRNVARNAGFLLRSREYDRAIHAARMERLGAPTPELRAAWREFAVFLEEEFAGAKTGSQIQLETYFEKLAKVWETDNTRDFETAVRRLGPRPSTTDPELSQQLAAAQQAISQWRAMLVAKHEGKFGVAFEAIQDIEPPAISPEQLAAARETLYVGAVEALAAYATEGRRRIFACRTPEEVDLVIGWLQEHDLSEMAIRNPTRHFGAEYVQDNPIKYSAANHVQGIARRWRAALQGDRQGDPSSVIRETTGLALYKLAPEDRAVVEEMRFDAQSSIDGPLEQLLDEAYWRLMRMRGEEELAGAMQWLQAQSSLEAVPEEVTRYREASMLGKYRREWAEAEGDTMQRSSTAWFRVGLNTRAFPHPRSPINALRIMLPHCRRHMIAATLDESRRRIAVCETPKESRAVVEWLVKQELSAAKSQRFEEMKEVARLWKRFFEFVEKNNGAGAESSLSQIRTRTAELGVNDDWSAVGFQTFIAEYEQESQQQLDAILAKVEAGFEAADQGKGLERLLLATEEGGNQNRGNEQLRDELRRLRNEVLLLAKFEQARDGDKMAYYRNKRYHPPPTRWSDWVGSYRLNLIVKACENKGYAKFDLKKGETLTLALLRTADEAIARKDWNQVILTLRTYDYCLISPDSLQSEIRGCQQLLLGLNAEQRGAMDSARQHFSAVLQCHGSHVPYEAAIAQLVKLNQAEGVE